MAKYIRTKDRIREIIEDFGGSCNVKSTYSKGRPSIDNFTVVSGVRFAPRADTIEELCDWLVFKLNGKIKVLYEDLDTALRVEGNDILIYKEIYGALDTDKGLIYVAKMNEKGELELL